MASRTLGVAAFAFLILSSALLVAPSAVLAIEVDGIAAKIGTDTVLRSDVYTEMRRMGAPDDSNYAVVLKQLVDRKLILRAAVASKMTMQEWVVENRVREIVKQSFGGDRNKLIEMLARQKLSYPEWYAKTKEDLIIGAMRWQVVDKNVSASPTEMRKEFEEHPDRYVKDHKVSVSVILLKPEEKAKREEISAALKTKSFEELGGRQFKDVTPAEFFKPDVVREIEKMSTGSISHWIEIDGWSYLLRKDGETSGRKLTFDEAYDEIEANVKEAYAKRLYEAWLERLRAETYVKIF